jgi:hypothetical protein
MGVFPAVANGNVGIILGPRQWWQNKWPWRDSGNIHMAGVYNGQSWLTPSHRAQVRILTEGRTQREDGGEDGGRREVEEALVFITANPSHRAQV